MAVYVDLEFLEGRDANTMLEAMDQMKTPFHHSRDGKVLRAWSARHQGGHITIRRRGPNLWRATVRTTGDWEAALGSFLDAVCWVSVHEGITKIAVDLAGAPWRRKRWAAGQWCGALWGKMHKTD